MKRIISTLIIFTFMLSAVNSVNLKKVKAAETENTSVAAGETADAKAAALVTLSEELAVQMAAGSFDKTYDNFSALAKAMTKKEELKQAWDKTVATIGKYVKVTKSSEYAKASYQVVEVILQYESSGLKVTFTYNSADKLDGIWFSYTPLELKPEVNDIFEEQKIVIGKEDYAVNGILTLPKKVKNPAVVILVHGSGTHDADETVGANKPFRDIAHGLAKKGIASIRYNERLLEHPTLATGKLTIYDDCLSDAKEAIKFAAGCKKVDPKRIIVAGHSLGGMMAPQIAAENKKVAGIISLAGSPRNMADIIYDQVEYYCKNSKSMTKVEIASTLTGTKQLVDQLKALKENDTAIISSAPASYWYSLKQINTSKIVKKLNIPILIDQGSADFQVLKDKDYTAWKTVLKGKKNVTFHLYKNLNHLFMTSNGKFDTTEYNVKGTVNQKVIDDMAAWINKVGK